MVYQECVIQSTVLYTAGKTNRISPFFKTNQRLYPISKG